MTRSTTLYNAPKCSKSSICRGKRDHFREPSGNLPGTFWESLGNHMDPLETFLKPLRVFGERLPLSVSTSRSLPGRLPGFLPGPSRIRVAMLILKL